MAASLNGFCSALSTRREGERAEMAALRAQLQQAEQETRELRRERDQVRECREHGWPQGVVSNVAWSGASHYCWWVC